MRTIGYARVSTNEQSLDLQIAALEAAKCDVIYEDKGYSGSRDDRPGLISGIAALQEGDKLVVWRLDRLGRSLISLVTLINQLAQRGVQFQSITEMIDTSSSGGRLVFHLMAALAEFERGLISERTKAGMNVVQSRGIHVGRPPLLSSAERQQAIDMVLVDGCSVMSAARHFGVHQRTIARAIQEWRAIQGSPDVEKDAPSSGLLGST